VVDKQMQTRNPGAFNKDMMSTTTTNIIGSDDCGTTSGIDLSTGSRDIEDRFVAKDVRIGDSVIATAGTPVTASLLKTLRERRIDALHVRSPLTCKLPKGTCVKCYGVNEEGNLPAIGDNVGAIDGQALTEPLTQMTMRTFHMGGLSGTRGAISGYAKIDKLFKMHRLRRDEAVLAQGKGSVESVNKTAGGTGFDLVIKYDKTEDGDSGKHFIPQHLWKPGRYKVGSKVERGDIMSKGIAHPDDLTKLKGMLPAQEYMVDQIVEAYGGQNVHLKRRTVENVIRSVGNTTKILDPGDSEFIFGDVAPYTVVQDYNERKLGKLPVGEAEGHRLQEKIPGVKKDSIVDDKVLAILNRLGKRKVEVGPKPIIHEPFMKGLNRIPVLRKDWMSQMGYRYIKDAIIEGATTGQESDLHDFAPVPAFAYGAEFGEAKGGRSKKEGVY
jgi:DNA-directed RNA polymerase subunit beta'